MHANPLLPPQLRQSSLVKSDSPLRRPRRDGPLNPIRVAAPGSTVKTSGRPSAAVGQSQVRGVSQLTEQECRNLGGAIYTAPQCKKTQQRCVIRLAGGQINAPRIDETAQWDCMIARCVGSVLALDRV